MRKMYGVIGGVVILALLMIGTWSAQAQEDLDATFVADDGSFTFDYPGDWEISVDDEDGSVSALGSDLWVFFYGPATLDDYGLGELEDPVAAAELLSTTMEDADVDEVETLDIGGRDAGGFVYTDPDFNGAFVFIVFSDGTLGLANGVSEGELDLETFLLMVASFDVGKGQSSSGGLSDLLGGEDADEPVSLEEFDQGYRDVIGELEDLELIVRGGDLVFTEDYAWFEGQGAFYTPLARNKPFTDFVMSAELSYTASNSSDFETCTLGMHVVWEGNLAIEYVNVGYANDGSIFYFDYNEEGDEFVDGVIGPAIDEPHVFTIIVMSNSLTVFVDGELVFDNVEIEERDGTWGVGLTGKAPGAKCEARDIWVVEVP
jgi:hypothetical protein